ncbi:MAG: AbrB/MazE/SpoVT family DNA-binding domain-containing protein [Gemmatimonadaceae bacterium]|nr:AbrB/MazE/SpoVT family DNA-binding domain-containing protein [Gemmatimonadaceae bacterium]
MKTRLVKVGNSRGVRLPKLLLEQAGIEPGDEVDLDVTAETGRIVITVPTSARRGWADAARLQAQRGDDCLLDEGTGTRFDAEEWQW